ncbi:GTPase HflX [Cerasicoccus maritimus]|uniref:GTPase HflX n=1 Tax=Cerasicoccus maritimus TaxID=490089 RepID=UPI0028528203|nr:GTPase HflX [Cerasicoccus maritimus]
MIETDDLNPMINSAFLLGVRGSRMPEGEAETLLEELEELVSNLNIGVAVKKVVKVREPNAAFLLGSGKVQEIAEEIKARGCDSLIFDEPLSAGQQRNWEKELGGKILVIDRQEIILDIFNSRATTKEASLQVELARLEYELPRMKRAWSHLDRQRGGGAVQRDAGETQLEMDQRIIRTRISRLKKELTEVLQHREVQRKKRQRVPLPTASIVGYTNAGKSSLLNRVTLSDVMAEDKLFATLDPTTRRADLPNGQTLLMTDTVGFIRRLPHRLVEAFKATLEEAVVATFLIHVLDASSPDVAKHYETTMNVLKELHADEKTIITVFNKIDMVEDRMELAMLRHDYPGALFISVKTGEGLDQLLDKCQECIGEWGENVELLIPHDRYDLVNKLHEAGAITNKEVQDDGVYIEGTVPQRLLDPVKPFLINGRTLA